MAADRKARWLGLSALVLSLAAPACAHDTILPVPTHCGDGKVDGDETCDPATANAGCVDCQVQAGWQCDEQACTTICGDGVQAGDEECDSTDRTKCDTTCRAGTRTGGCDLEGWWATRQTTFSVDDVFNDVQTTSNWFLWHLHDTAADGSVIVDHSLNCGLNVSGSKVDVHLTPGGIDGLIHKAPQDGSGGRPARIGRGFSSGGYCGVEMERAYFVRGCVESLLPASRPWPELSTLAPLPTASDTTNASDDDGDGLPGVAWVVSRGANGIRNTCQRDWGDYYTDANEAEARYQIPPSSLEFDVRAHFDNEETILEITQCPPVGCGPLKASSKPDNSLQHRLRMRWLGKDLAEPRVSAMIARMPGEDTKADETTCTNLRAALPHDPTSK